MERPSFGKTHFLKAEIDMNHMIKISLKGRNLNLHLGKWKKLQNSP